MRALTRPSRILLIGTALALTSNSAIAQDGSPESPPSKADDGGADEARKSRAANLYEQGRKAVVRGDRLAARGKAKDARTFYGHAAGLFLEAYRTVDNPLLLYVLGQVYQSRSEPVWARRCYQRYLERDPQGRRVSEARERIGQVDVRLNALASAGADPSGQAPEAAFDPAGVCYQPEPAPEPEPEPEPATPVAESRTGYRIGFWSSAGVTATSATVALVTLLQVGNFEADKDDAVLAYQAVPGHTALDARDACSDAAGRIDAGADDDNLRAIVAACDTGKSRARVSNITQGLSVAALLATGFFAYKLYMRKSGRDGKQAGMFAPMVTRDSVGAQVLLRF